MKNSKFFTTKKSAIRSSIFLLLVMFAAFAGAQAQNQQLFVVIEYMKVPQGDEQKYIDLERNYWKKIHQERVNNGEIERWILYQVLYSGSGDEYNFVTGTVVSDPAKLENPFAGIDPVKVLPGEDVDRIMQETNNSRQLVKRNLIQRVSTADEANPPGQFKYIAVNFMKVKPGNEGKYMDAENRIWKPVHQQFVKDGARTGWSVWQAVYPWGAGTDFQYATTDYFADFSKINAADMEGTFKKVHAGKDLDQLFQETNDSRDLVRSELWRVIDSVP